VISIKCLSIVALLTAGSLLASSRIVVTVVEHKTGNPVTGLTAQDFAVFDDKTPRRVEASEVVSPTLDVMLLLDTSLVGGMVQPVADTLISQLGPKEQMAVVSVHSSADLLQDFTSSRESLQRAISQVKYGNTPRLLDGLFAAIEGGFQSSNFRRVALLLTAGYEGDSRVSEKQVIKLARRNGVSIFPVYMAGSEKYMLENLARQTGGASFSLRDMKKSKADNPGPRIFGVLRSHYVVTVFGNAALGEKLRVEVKRPEKLFVSAMPAE
jgi:VWFA-related protein